MTNKELNSLRLENEARFSKMLSYVSIDDPESYDKMISAIVGYNNLSSNEKGNFGKLLLDVPSDLQEAVIDYVRGGDI